MFGGHWLAGKLALCARLACADDVCIGMVELLACAHTWICWLCPPACAFGPAIQAQGGTGSGVWSALFWVKLEQGLANARPKAYSNPKLRYLKKTRFFSKNLSFFHLSQKTLFFSSTHKIVGSRSSRYCSMRQQWWSTTTEQQHHSPGYKQSQQAATIKDQHRWT